MPAMSGFRSGAASMSPLPRRTFVVVIAGLVPAISIRVARRCPNNRDDRAKPGHDAAPSKLLHQTHGLHDSGHARLLFGQEFRKRLSRHIGVVPALLLEDV